MEISVATFIFTFLFSAFAIFTLALLLRCKAAYGYIGIRFLTAFCWIILLRLILPMEFPSFTITIPSEKFMPLVRDTLKYSVITVHSHPFTILSLLIFVWLIGIMVYNLKLFQTYHRLSLKSRFSDEHYDSAEKILNTLKTERGIKKETAVIQNPFFTTPVLAGIRHVTIFLPPGDYSEAELSFILQHEITHLQKHDNLSKLIMELINSCYWWNPLFYLLKKQINTVFEFRADAEVLKRMPGSVIPYMECVLDLYKRHLSPNAFPLTAAFCGTNKNNITKRFQYMTAPNTQYKNSLFLTLLISMFLLVGSFSIVFEAEYPLHLPGIYSAEELEDCAYLLKTSDNKYHIYIDGVYGGEVSMEIEDFKKLPVYETEEVFP